MSPLFIFSQETNEELKVLNKLENWCIMIPSAGAGCGDDQWGSAGSVAQAHREPKRQALGLSRDLFAWWNASHT